MAEDERIGVGTRIARARREAGLTQRALADHLGISARSVQNYEAGTVIPYRHLPRIESLTGKRPGWILAGDHADADLRRTLDALHATLDRHHSLLQDHLQMLLSQTRLMRDHRQVSEQRRAERGVP